MYRLFLVLMGFSGICLLGETPVFADPPPVEPDSSLSQTAIDHGYSISGGGIRE